MELRTNINIETQVRIHVLYDVIENLAKNFNFPDVYNTLYKGIVDKQIIKTINAYYIDATQDIVGQVSFDIDWNKHEVFASTSTGERITLSKDKSLTEQFADWSQDIFKYVDDMQKALNVNKVKVTYLFRDEIYNDKKAHDEAMSFLGLVDVYDDFSISKSKGKKFEREMSLVSQMLPELRINIKSDS